VSATESVILFLPKTQIRAYRWCNPPRMGCATMSPVPVGNSHSDILMMEAAQDGQGQRLADSLDGARDRRILPQ